MPDYSCTFIIRNSTNAPLVYAWKSEPVHGHWVDETIPSVIAPQTEAIFKLKDNLGFEGSEGTINYEVKWPCETSRANILFGMRLPYSATEEFPAISWADIQYDPQEVFDIKQECPPRTGVNPITGIFEICYRDNLPFGVSLDKITLPNPLFPVLMEDGLCPDFAIDHPLWSAAEAGKAIAATTCVNSTPNIKLVGKVDPKIAKLEFKMIGECIDNGHGSAATIEVDLGVDQNTGAYEQLIPLALNDTHPGIAWGFQGTISWKVLVKNTGKFIPVTTSPIEIYAISRALHKFLAVEGIPLHLLRFIVLPTRNWPKAPGGVTNYVEYVVKRIHGESGFKYDAAEGSSSYASLMSSNDLTDPGSFQLAKWLKNQQSITPTKECHVNCYDQAGIVGICLGFFFPDNYEDRSQGLRWFMMFPFGFVEGDLVGWGPVNNPFFKGNKDLMILDNPKDSKRTAFKRHVFLTYNGKVLDATCGPKTGTLTLNEYIENAIDHTEGLGKKLDWYTGPGTFSSVTLHTTMADQGGNTDFNQVARDNDGDADFEELDPVIEKVIEAVAWGANKPNFAPKVDLIIRFNVNKLLEEMQSTFEGSFKVDGGLYHSQITGFKNGGHHVCWNLKFTDAENNAHAVNLDIFISRRTFTSRLALRRFMRLSNNPGKAEVKETKDGIKYQLEEGAISRAYWVYGTVCVNLSAHKDLGHDAFVSVVEELQKFLAKNDSSDETKVSVGKPVFDKEQQKGLKVGKTMKVSVDAERAVEFKWSYLYGNVVVVGVEKPSGVSNTYTFELYARKPGFDNITFTFVDEFYREETTTMYVNVEA
ncbi:hypothetical protein DFP73DRAFT_395020 [Morchella snyderi]|nr:hypothetical protein DFP73DRAFT_395020 [Morchella snyderi]